MLEKCKLTGWDRNDKEPILRTEDHKGQTLYEIVCPCCFLHTGLYESEARAEQRWRELNISQPISTYNALSYEEKFPDHKDGSTKERNGNKKV